MNIIINGKISTIEALLNTYQYDDGEYDIDTIFYPMNFELLDKVINSMENSYDVKTVIEKYLSISNDNLSYEV